MSILGIVPARGGSKRIPDKNIRGIGGKPMMAHILEAASKADIFDTIHVSTDSDKVAEVAAELGFKPDFLRDSALADDQTPLRPVLKWVLEQYITRGLSYDIIILLMPTAVFVEPKDICQGLELFLKNKAQTPVMTMARYPAPIEWAFEKQNKGFFRPLNPRMLEVRSQDLTDKYFDAGLFDIFSKEQILDDDLVGDFEYLSVEVDSYKVIDIDTLDDLRSAEVVFDGIRLR